MNLIWLYRRLQALDREEPIPELRCDSSASTLLLLCLSLGVFFRQFGIEEVGQTLLLGAKAWAAWEEWRRLGKEYDKKRGNMNMVGNSSGQRLGLWGWGQNNDSLNASAACNWLRIAATRSGKAGLVFFPGGWGVCGVDRTQTALEEEGSYTLDWFLQQGINV